MAMQILYCLYCRHDMSAISSIVELFQSVGSIVGPKGVQLGTRMIWLHELRGRGRVDDTFAGWRAES